MNYCLRCESLYREPGTCNCYAAALPPVVPTNPTRISGTGIDLRDPAARGAFVDLIGGASATSVGA